MKYESIAAQGNSKCPGKSMTRRLRLAFLHHHNRLRSDLIHGRLKNKDNAYMPKGKNMLKLVKMY